MLKYFVIFFIFFANNIFAQEKLSITDQQKDLEELYTTLLSQHPSICTKQDSAALTKIVDSVRNTLTENASQGDVLKWMGCVVNSLGCGHTSIFLPDNKIFRKMKFLPIKMKWIENKAVVITCRNKVIPKGAIITKWNGANIDKWFDTLSFINGGVDNNNEEARKQAILNTLIYESDYLYKKQTKRVQVEYTFNGGDTQMIRLPFVSEDSLNWLLADFDEDKMYPLYYFNDTTNKTMYVKLSEFMFDDENPSSAYELAKEMDEEKFENIIIDLRGNGGGSILFGEYFLGYFLSEPTFIFDTIGMRLAAKTPFAKNLKRKLFYSGGDLPQEINNDFIFKEKNNTTFNMYRQIKKEKINFSQKKIFVLIDNTSFSMAPICALLLKNDGAILIGEEAGGRGYLNYALLMHQILLKKSFNFINIPFFKATTSHKEKIDYRKNLLPNHFIKWTVQNVIDKKDPCIEKVKELIK
jgi:Peptidase family S41